MHPLSCSAKQSGHCCTGFLSGLDFCYLHKGFPFFEEISLSEGKEKNIFSVLLNISEQESRRKAQQNATNYFILLIAKVFVFPSVSDKDSVLQNCWKKKRIGSSLPIRTWRAVVNLQTEEEIQLHFALWTWKPQFGWENMLESEKADAAFQVCHSLFKCIAQ